MSDQDQTSATSDDGLEATRTGDLPPAGDPSQPTPDDAAPDVALDVAGDADVTIDNSTTEAPSEDGDAGTSEDAGGESSGDTSSEGDGGSEASGD